MRFYLILFFCLSVIFIGCHEGIDRTIPPGIIAEHNMAELLTDIHIVDGSLFKYSQIPDSLNSHGLGLYLAVFKMHHTDTAQFKKSLKFYSTRPDLLNEIYEGINTRLKKKLDSLQKIKPKVNIDSISKAKMRVKADSLQKIKVKADSLLKVKAEKKVKKSKKHKHKIKHALPQ